LSRSTLNYVAGLIRRHRKAIKSLWRQLNPGQQALLVLVHLRKGETFAELAAGFGVSTATAWRYVQETVMLLSARSPKLAQALRKAKKDGLHYLVLDGTLIPTDRVKADRPFYSGKHRVHGMNIQVIATPDGTILWTSGALPGKSHDLTAARIWGILRALEKAGIVRPWPTRPIRVPKGRSPHRTRARTSPSRKSRPTAPTPAFAGRASARMPSSRAGASSASSAAARTRPDTCARRLPSCRTTSSPEDEKRSMIAIPSMIGPSRPRSYPPQRHLRLCQDGGPSWR
jgi:Helix-turn-helix of DDE superfamily endonuclease/DDE superfamily endonuclease